MIGSEIVRAQNWQRKNEKYFCEAIERAFPLIKLSLADPKWQDDRYILPALIKELKKFQTGTRTDNIESLYQALWRVIADFKQHNNDNRKSHLPEMLRWLRNHRWRLLLLQKDGRLSADFLPRLPLQTPRGF